MIERMNVDDLILHVVRHVTGIDRGIVVQLVHAAKEEGIVSERERWEAKLKKLGDLVANLKEREPLIDFDAEELQAYERAISIMSGEEP